MQLSLPTDPNGEQYEDLVVSILTALGYFVESNMTLSHDGKEILELDVVATPVGEGSDSRILFEVKKERFSFTNTFKLYGQKEYLGIKSACLVSMRGCEDDHLPVFQEKGSELGITMRPFPLKGGRATDITPQRNSLPDEMISRLAGPLWYQNICRRVALAELRVRCKDNKGSEPYEKARKYLFTTRASFFQKEPLSRAETLYKAYFDYPKLSGSLISARSKSGNLSESELWTQARDTHKLLDIQSIMDLESMARIVIVKNALDDAFERGDSPPPVRSMNVHGLTFGLPRHNLPPKYFKGLRRMREHEHGAKIPYLFESFYTVFGGYLFKNREEELELLSNLTTIPADQIISCLRFMEDFFGPFFIENKYEMMIMMGVPAIVRGGGTFARRNAFVLSDYKDFYGEAHWLLDKWHNAICYALEPHLNGG